MSLAAATSTVESDMRQVFNLVYDGLLFLVVDRQIFFLILPLFAASPEMAPAALTGQHFQVCR